MRLRRVAARAGSVASDCILQDPVLLQAHMKVHGVSQAAAHSCIVSGYFSAMEAPTTTAPNSPSMGRRSSVTNAAPASSVPLPSPSLPAAFPPCVPLRPLSCDAPCPPPPADATCVPPPAVDPSWPRSFLLSPLPLAFSFPVPLLLLPASALSGVGSLTPFAAPTSLSAGSAMVPCTSCMSEREMTRAGVAGPTALEAVAGICAGSDGCFTARGAVVLGGKVNAVGLNAVAVIFTSAMRISLFGLSSDGVEIGVLAICGRGGVMVTAGRLPGDQITSCGNGTCLASRFGGRSG